VVRELELVVNQRGWPHTIVSDNGTELTSNAVLHWAAERVAQWRVSLPLFRVGEASPCLHFKWTEETLDYFYPDLTYWLLNDLTIDEPPGRSFHYADCDTELMALILKRATHRTLAEYLQEKIWEPLGMEYPATWSIDSDRDGLEMAFVLLNARAIDFAKFGRLYLNDGGWNGAQIVPRDWVIESTTADPNDRRPWETYPAFQSHGGYYKYYWWGHREAGGYTFEAQGLWGQYIFVSPKNKVVIVRTGSDWGVGLAAWQGILAYLANHIPPE